MCCVFLLSCDRTGWQQTLLSCLVLSRDQIVAQGTHSGLLINPFHLNAFEPGRIPLSLPGPPFFLICIELTGCPLVQSPIMAHLPFLYCSVFTWERGSKDVWSVGKCHLCLTVAESAPLVLVALLNLSFSVVPMCFRP